MIETHVLTHGNLLDHHACFAMADSKSQSITSSGVVAFDSTSKTLANVPERVSLLYPTAFLNFNAPSPEEWPAAKRSEIHALFTFGEPRISGSTLDLYPNLKIVCNFGNGVDHIDLAAAKQRGILVGNTPDAPAASTADLALGIRPCSGYGHLPRRCIDLTDPQPLPRDHPLLKLSNVIISPHIGSATAQTRNAMGDNAIANLVAALKGLPIPNRVV